MGWEERIFFYFYESNEYSASHCVYKQADITVKDLNINSNPIVLFWNYSRKQQVERNGLETSLLWFFFCNLCTSNVF